MSKRLTKHITPSMFIALIALVLAATGGAFAASSGSGGAGSSLAKASASVTPAATAAKAKPKGKAGPRGPAGKNGAPGATGAAGATGPAGAVGATGPAGAGTAGATGAQGIQGVKGEEGKTGPEGKSGFTETLPKEKTETGSWAVRGHATGEEIDVPVSFNIPLAEPLEESAVHVILSNGKELNGKGEEQESTVCLGKPEEPKALPGNFCLYRAPIAVELEKGTRIVQPGGFGALGVGRTGGFLVFVAESASTRGFGTWAVTAPE